MNQNFTNPAEQYFATRNGIGIVPRSENQFLQIEGKDAVDLLNRISTNELKDFRNGEARSTILVTEKARVVDFVTLFQNDNNLLLEVSLVNKDKVKAWISKFIITEEAAILEPTIQFAKYSLIGPEVPGFMRNLGISIDNSDRNSFQTSIINGMTIIAACDPLFPDNVWNLYVPISAEKNGLEISIFLSQDHTRLISREVFQIFRIEEGSPAVGKELTEKVNPLEAGLDRFVSFTKGCYLGQEVISRLHAYKKLQRKLSGFIVDAKTEEGSLVLHEGVNVGWITSVCYSFGLDTWIALGYRKTNISSNNFKIGESNSSEHTANIVDLPFTRNLSEYLPHE